MKIPTRIRAAISASLAMGFATAASAQDAGETKPEATFGTWAVVCTEQTNCQAYVNLAQADTRQLALTASFYFVDGADDPTGVVTLPLGVALKPGVRIRTAQGAAPIQLQPEVCYPDGCRAVFTLTSDVLAELLTAAAFHVDFFAYAQANQPGSIKVPTDGLDKALEYIAVKQSAAVEE